MALVLSNVALVHRNIQESAKARLSVARARLVVHVELYSSSMYFFFYTSKDPQRIKLKNDRNPAGGSEIKRHPNGAFL